MLEAEIRMWKGHHNNLSLISRLPPEILSAIFKFVASAVQTYPCPYSKVGWIGVTHVCTDWRRIGLDCASLWTTIRFSPPTWAEEMLARSKMAPLTVVANVSSNNARCMQLMQATLTSMNRIQKLSLNQTDCRPDNPLEKILASLVEPVPLLDSFSVSFFHSGDLQILPRRLFSGEAPRLRELELHYCGLAWDAPILRALTSLKISNIHHTARPSVALIMAALCNMPNLETLELRSDTLPSRVSIDAVTKTGIISLPHLTHLHIESDAPEGGFMLSRLIYPSSASIALVCTVRYEWANTAGGSHTFPSIQGFCKVLGQSRPVRCLVAKYTMHPKTLTLMTFDVSGTCLERPNNPKISLTLQLDTNIPGATFLEDMQRSLWGSISMKDIESLHVDTTSDVCLDWLDIFTSLAATKLQRLRISGVDQPDFLHDFSPDPPPPHKGRLKLRIPLKIPSLRELAIEGWIFDYAVASGTSIELLKLCLEDRRKRGAAIHELFLIKCRHITEEDVGTLMKTVKVTWDGLENFSEDEDESEDGSSSSCPISGACHGGGYDSDYI